MDYRGIAFFVLFLKGCFITSMADDYRSITCMVRLYDLDGHTYSSDKEIFKLICPPHCAQYSYAVVGSGPYLGSSSICRAAVHSGKLGSKGGPVRIETVKEFVTAFNGASTNNGVETEGADWSGGIGGFKVLDSENSTIAVISSMKTNTSVHQSSSPLIETVSYSSSPASVVQYTSSLISTRLTTRKTSSSFTTRSTKSATSILLQHNTEESETERQRSTQRPAASRMTKATTQDNHLGDGTKPMDDKTNLTLAPKSSTSIRVLSNTSQRLLSGLGVTDEVVVPSNVFEKTVEKVSLILMFVVGVIFGTAFVILRKKRKNIWRHLKRKRQRRNRDSKDDETLCVCYQTLDASTQGLLYDPDTCVRSCTKKQQEAQDFKLQTKPSLKKQEICYEDECRDKCSGNCNPEMFEF